MTGDARRWAERDYSCLFYLVHESTFGRVIKTMDGRWRANLIGVPASERLFDDKTVAKTYVERQIDIDMADDLKDVSPDGRWARDAGRSLPPEGVGEWRKILDEKAEIRRMLVEQGITGPDLIFKIEGEYIRRHQNDPTMRQRQEAARKVRKPPSETVVYFTVAELERLVEHFGGANDPVSASIGDKAKAAFEKLTTV